MTRFRPMLLLAAAVVSLATACGDDPSIADYYPTLPSPTGEAQVAFAGEISGDKANELVAGPAATGMVGDYFLRNDKASFVISAPTRVIGVVPQGGNVIDAALRDGTTQLSQDHFGEMSLLYVLGRTCEHSRVEVVRDGSRGGVAALRAIGKTAPNDFISIKGIGLFPVDVSVDPDIEDNLECATTYVLAPGATHLEVHFTLFNPTDAKIAGPLGTLSDTGGEVEAWGTRRGFERVSLGDLNSLSEPAPIDYTLYQGPGSAYGIIPRHELPADGAAPVQNVAVLISGVSILLVGADAVFDLLNRDSYFLSLAPSGGFRQQFDFAVGRDAEDIEVVYRSSRGEPLTPIGGSVSWSAGGAAVGARVGVYEDINSNGQVDDDDAIVTYLDVAADGSFAGQVLQGNLLLRAEVKDVGRSASAPVGAQVAMTIPSPIRVDYQIVDAGTGAPMPGRLLVVGQHPAMPDVRIFGTYDRLPGVVQSLHAMRGTSTDVGDGADPALYLPAGGTYRIYASRGTEWSVHSLLVIANADADLEFSLRRVAPATGYLSTEWHVHQIGSPDSPVNNLDRIRTALSAGIEMFSVNDHDYVANLQPLAVANGVDDLVRIVSGIEVTPFAYGHFNAWPMTPDETSPNRGAVDWGRGMEGFSMIPAEIFAAMRSRGAQLVQVNHPRSASAFSAFQSYFDRANLKYDYVARTMFGDFVNAPLPNADLRLPNVSLWDASFNALEVWNGFGQEDTDADGRRENTSLDPVMRDWFNMLSMGMVVTPTGNSDTHTDVADPMGMPRTYVRVADESGEGLRSGASEAQVLGTLTGGTARDIVVTDGPMMAVTVGGEPALGKVVSGSSVTFQVTVTAPEWADFDTLEVFANATPTSPAEDSTALTPTKCYTSRPLNSLGDMDPCKLANLAPERMDVTLIDLGPGNQQQRRAVVTITMDAADIATRAGATGTDAWFVFRVSGDRAIFPIMSQGAIDETTLPILVNGSPGQVRQALQGRGVQAIAFTAPVFVDFDGGGYRAPFAP